MRKFNFRKRETKFAHQILGIDKITEDEPPPLGFLVKDGTGSKIAHEKLAKEVLRRENHDPRTFNIPEEAYHSKAERR